MTSPVTIYTVGHGRHPFAHFLGLLECTASRSSATCAAGALALAAVQRARARRVAQENGIGYEWLPECGGKVVAPPAEFQRGWSASWSWLGRARGLLCSESRPLTEHRPQPRANCHRVGCSRPPCAHAARASYTFADGDTLEIDEATLPSIWRDDRQ